MARSQEQPQSLDYAAASQGLPKAISFGEQVGLVAAILPLILLLLFHGAVAVSPWTLGELCRAADDDSISISSAASELTSIGASLHFGAFLVSPLFCLAGFVLFVRAQIQRRTRSQIVPAVMAVCSAASAVVGGSYAMDLAGF